MAAAGTSYDLCFPVEGTGGPLHWVVGYHHSQGPLGTQHLWSRVRMHLGRHLPHLLSAPAADAQGLLAQRHQADQRGCPAYQPGRVPVGTRLTEAEGGQKARQYVTPALGRFQTSNKGPYWDNRQGSETTSADEMSMFRSQKLSCGHGRGCPVLSETCLKYLGVKISK